MITIVKGEMGQGMNLSNNLDAFKKWIDEIERCDKMEAFYDKNHKQEHFVLRNGKIWHKGNGEGKYWDYHCRSREAIRDAHEILRI